jgi:ATP-binding cassette, subfamily B, bacterial
MQILDKLVGKLSTYTAQLAYLPQTFSLVSAASHNWTMAWVILLFIQGLLPVATVYLSRLVVNSLVEVTGKGISVENIQVILLPVALMGGVLLLTEFLQGISEWVRTAQSEFVQDHISSLIQSQSITIDYGCYESSEFNDYIERARDGASSRSLALLENTGTTVQNTITLFAIVLVLLPYGVLLPVVILASALPAFYVATRLSLKQYQWSQKTTTDRRRLMYYQALLTHPEAAAELRLFNFGLYFQSAYKKIRHRLRREQIKLIRTQSVGRLFAGVIALLMTGIVLVWTGRQALLGIIKLGDLALFYQAFNQGQNIIKSLLGSLGQIYKNSLFISDLFTFLGLKPQIIDPPNPVPVPLPLQQGINFRQVSFSYPGSQEAVFDNFNLDIPAGKIVAIVGDNGAGKSTLIKLLCRFYDPDAGRIEIDGTDIRDFRVQQVRELFTVLFQMPIPYFLSAGEAIALGDTSVFYSQDEVEIAAKQANIHDKIMCLPQAYDSILGKLFPNGSDLSGGQWQRLALARAFYRQAQIIVLDEPTSALDPWTERDWLERFRNLANGRTAIVITHRFTLAMRADIIHVMRAGQIVESGNHNELLALGGLYAESWKSQMESHQEVSV